MVFNFDKTAQLNKDVDFNRLGINPAEFVSVKELWNGTTCAPSALKISVPAKDVHIYRFDRDASGVQDIKADNANKISVNVSDGSAHVSATEPISSVDVYGIDGTTVNSVYACNSSNELNFDVPAHGMAIVKVKLASGMTETFKTILK